MADQLTKTRFHRDAGSGADLRGADLRQADLSRDVVGVSQDWEGANLCGADLGDANLAGANLACVRYDARTRWPRGFDPRQRGAVLQTTPPVSR